jgi:chromosome segregation ATPase
MNELSSYKDHAAKSLEINKISFSNDLKGLQSKLEQIETEKNQYFYQMQSMEKELRQSKDDLKTTKEAYKKEIEDTYEKMQHIMQDASIKKEDVIKQSCKIVELMDDIREKNSAIEDKEEALQNLQEKEKDLNIELERARGVIHALQGNMTLSEKERSKESRLRKEEQGRLLELIEQNQKFKQQLGQYKEKLEHLSKELDNMMHDNQTLNNMINEYKTEIQNLNKELQNQSEITSSKSSTIKDYERRLESANDSVSQKHEVVKQLEGQIDSLRTDIYDYKNTILEKNNDIKYLNNKIKEFGMVKENEQLFSSSIGKPLSSPQFNIYSIAEGKPMLLII